MTLTFSERCALTRGYPRSAVRGRSSNTERSYRIPRQVRRQSTPNAGYGARPHGYWFESQRSLVRSVEVSAMCSNRERAGSNIDSLVEVTGQQSNQSVKDGLARLHTWVTPPDQVVLPLKRVPKSSPAPLSLRRRQRRLSPEQVKELIASYAEGSLSTTWLRASKSTGRPCLATSTDQKLGVAIPRLISQASKRRHGFTGTACRSGTLASCSPCTEAGFGWPS